MKYKRLLYLAVIVALVVSLLPLVYTAQAQTSLPTAAQVGSGIKVGWNIGNSLEVPIGETGWGNPMVSQTLINSVKAAGFNAVRIPVAWDSHATNNTIDPAWLARVKEVVDYAINQDMYVIINIHWDGGWLEEHPLYTHQVVNNQKQNAYWTQIANYFKNYNERLLFAGTNEVHADYGEPTAEHIEVQQSYNQTFVNAVRATGGNNASRTLVVQTYNTNIWHGLRYFTMPTDSASNRLMLEVHHYDPYDYTLNGSGPCLAWGAAYTQYAQCSWAQEAYVDDLFNQVKTRWVDQGVPVIIGEYGVATRPNLDLASRAYYLRYMNAAAIANGIKTFYWDNGVLPSQTNGFALFNRSTGAVVDQAALNAVIQGAIPCTSCTATPTKTPTRTATITMTPCYGCGFKLQYKAGDTSASTNQLTPQFKIFNNSGASVPVNEFTIRYWYTNEGDKAQGFACDFAAVGCPNVNVSFTKLVYPQTGASHFLEVGFSTGAGSIAAGGNSAEVQVRVNRTDWTNYTQTGDYSFDPTKTAFADWERVTLYRNGGLVWGVEPGMGPTSTPGPGNTPTRTFTPVPVVTTLTPTTTATRTPTPVISPTITLTATQSVVATNTASPTLSASPTRTRTSTAGPSATRTRTPTSGPSATRTPTSILGASPTPIVGASNTPVVTTAPPTATRTFTPTSGPSATATIGGGTCTPTSTITVPFTFDGAGTFCWQASSLGGYINSWNTTSISVNGMNVTNIWVGSGSYPAKINGFYYVSYNSSVAWGHFEVRP